MTAFSDIPWYLLTFLLAIVAAVIVGYAGVIRDIRRDLRDPPP